MIVEQEEEEFSGNLTYPLADRMNVDNGRKVCRNRIMIICEV